ncbi:hypothetical protein HYW84_04225 [Candidatus Peregrinibacteria bacterium]|nr:hypothetical protein [Candidatus Peregrinibacteria bacterium]
MGKQINFRFAWIALAACMLFLVPHAALAQEPGRTFVSGATQVTMFLITIINAISWLTLSLLDFIMDPQVMFGLGPGGGDGALLNMLREIWQFTRDMVNLGFALGLIIGAIIMIVTADAKIIADHRNKFVLAVVLVNFSWFIPRVIFDLSQVLTYTVYQIPSLMGNECTMPPTDEDPQPRPCKIVVEYAFFERNTRTIGDDGVNRPGGGRPESRGWYCPLKPLVCVRMVPINEAPAEVHSGTKILHGLVVNHARMQWLAKIRPREADVRLPRDGDLLRMSAELLGFMAKLVIVLILHIAIVFPLVAMVAAFFIRIPVIWVSMAFMPLVALGFAFPKLREGEYGNLFWKWQEHFLQAVFLPVRVAIPFVIGLIMLNAGAQLPVPDNFGNVAIAPIIVGVSNWWQFLWMGIAMFIIWKYSFDALKGDKAGFMGMFTEKIQSIGSSLGSVAMQIPTSIPLIPMPGSQVHNPRTGQMETERTSIGQWLRGADPRRWRDELRTGRVDGGALDRIMGRHGAQAVNQQAVNQITANNRVAININSGNFQRALDNRGDNAARKQFIADFAALRNGYTHLGSMSEEQILAQLRAASVINDARHKELEDLLRDIRTRPPT